MKVLSMNKTKALHKLIQIEKISGEHSINWHDEYNRYETTIKFREKMEDIANELNLTYSTDINDFFEEDEIEYLDDADIEDNIATEIFWVIEKYLINEILE